MIDSKNSRSNQYYKESKNHIQRIPNNQICAPNPGVEMGVEIENGVSASYFNFHFYGTIVIFFEKSYKLWMSTGYILSDQNKRSQS